MPIYLYENPETGEVKEVLQKSKEEHVYFDENNLKWKRVWTIPHASVDTQADPFSEKAFSDSTNNKKMTIGDLWDKSKEMSQKRADKSGGQDPVKKDYESKARKLRGGKQIRD